MKQRKFLKIDLPLGRSAQELNSQVNGIQGEVLSEVVVPVP